MGTKTANYPYGWAGGQITTDYQIPYTVGTTTITNGTQALEFLAGVSTGILKLDLPGISQGRITARVITASASVNTPKVQMKYFTSLSTTASDYLTMGVSEIEFSTFTGQTYGDSGWIELVPGARINNVFIAVFDIGGDGAADPAIGSLTLQFR